MIDYFTINLRPKTIFKIDILYTVTKLKPGGNVLLCINQLAAVTFSDLTNTQLKGDRATVMVKPISKTSTCIIFQ